MSASSSVFFSSTAFSVTSACTFFFGFVLRFGFRSRSIKFKLSIFFSKSASILSYFFCSFFTSEMFDFRIPFCSFKTAICSHLPLRQLPFFLTCYSVVVNSFFISSHNLFYFFCNDLFKLHIVINCSLHTI